MGATRFRRVRLAASARGSSRLSAGVLAVRSLGCLAALLVATLVLCAVASGTTASDRAASLQPRVVTPCLQGGHPGDIAPACVQAVARARALLGRSGGSPLSIAPAAPASSFSTTSSSGALPPSGGNSLELTNVTIGSTQFNVFGSYINGESVIYCGGELHASETYGACAYLTFNDAVTGTKAPSINEATDTEFDACGKVVGGSHTEGWSDSGTPEEISSGGWVGGRDQQVPANQASACPGIWTVVYSFSQTFTNKETLTAEASGTFKISLPPAPLPEELYGSQNPGEPNYVQSCEGEPVDCETGNDTESQTDLNVGGLGVPLTFTRTIGLWLEFVVRRSSEDKLQRRNDNGHCRTGERQHSDIQGQRQNRSFERAGASAGEACAQRRR
jgi:hypothetical protein